MMQRLAPVAVLLVISMSGAAPTTAQSATVDPADLTAGLAQLNATLLEMKELLAIQIETQGLDLLLKRSELVSTQVAQLESLLRSAESTRTSLEDELRHMKIEQEMMETQMRSGSMDAEAFEIEAYSRQIEERIEHARDRLRQAEREVVNLQSRLDAKQRDLDDWQDVVDRRLSNI
jgi:chromosome segregation ATPase